MIYDDFYYKTYFPGVIVFYYDLFDTNNVYKKIYTKFFHFDAKNQNLMCQWYCLDSNIKQEGYCDKNHFDRLFDCGEYSTGYYRSVMIRV